jgi:hypothetical protein
MGSNSSTPSDAMSYTSRSQNLSFILDATVLKLPWTFPGGLPKIKFTIASLAI